jgi:hypothetical protein
MDWEHDYYQNPSNANRRPSKAFYLDVLQHGMESYSREDVADCISAYHGAEDDVSSPSTVTDDDIQAVGGSNWFASDNFARSYTDYDSEMEYVAQYHYLTNPAITGGLLGEERRDKRDGSRTVLPPRDLSETSRSQVTWNVPDSDVVDEVAVSYASRILPKLDSVTSGIVCPLGEEGRDKRDGSRTVLPPRDLSEASRSRVTRDVPIPDYIDGLATECEPHNPNIAPSTPHSESSDGKWGCQQAECGMQFATRNKLYRHLQEKSHFVDCSVPAYQTTPGASLAVVTPSRKPHVGTEYAFRGYKYAEARIRSSGHDCVYKNVSQRNPLRFQVTQYPQRDDARARSS